MNKIDDTTEAWDINAAFWDNMMREGNNFHLTLIGPVVEQLLQAKPNQAVLDIACGNGHFSRRLMKLGVNVVALDGSRQMIEIARKKSPPKIEYHVIDATHQTAMESLGTEAFDGAVCNMALMDMATLSPLFKALSHLLKKEAPFVFSISHPCFNMPQMTFFSEMTEQDGNLKSSRGVKINHYITPGTYAMRAIEGQEVPHKVFHRSLSFLLREAFQEGFVLDDCREPTFGPSDELEAKLRWQDIWEIPPVFVGRMRKV